MAYRTIISFASSFTASAFDYLYRLGETIVITITAVINWCIWPILDGPTEVALQGAAREGAPAPTTDHRLLLLPWIRTRTALEDTRRLHWDLG